ncbi:glyoxalase I [Nadsonia fulvescens var. elongata DSM 6958]|uniref:Lactoylglutathione lyase n=1 Tax=Nadsonia fulvescens var. elongata DSM 6958 TaxID=857566 RepID=A0A1E3PN94_9ASCO|nr:glyoxalase I [Nadsonia fulvescens var. elongata DSM 6958]
MSASATAAASTDPKSYKFNHTMIRVRDPKVSIDFYGRNFGMSVMRKYEFSQFQFDVYYLAFDGADAQHHGIPWYKREGLLEITHNYGTESDAEFKGYHNGNSEPGRGFGHICFSVDNLQACEEQLLNNNVKFQKKLADGRQKDIAFALDPDGYWIELIRNKEAPAPTEQSKVAHYRFNHTMIRVKDIKASLDFYQNKLGMKLLRTSDHPNSKFTLYFLGFDPENKCAENSGEGVSDREGILELTHNWGTESDPEFKGYHNGNTDPQGFGHLALSVDNIEAACDRFESIGVPFKKKLTDGSMKTIAFILDPDNYWIEIIPQNELPGMPLLK